MSNKRFITSDHHLLHHNIYRFTDDAGHRIRPWAQNAHEGDEMMIDAWNAVVRPGDTVYHLGDIAIKRPGLKLLERMNGRKILIRGNHDIFRLKDYLPHFADIRGSHKLGAMILSHYPIHPDSIPRWCLANVHGHIHQNTVMRRSRWWRKVPDTRYFNMCVEAIGLAPIEIDDLEARIIARQKGQSKT